MKSLSFLFYFIWSGIKSLSSNDFGHKLSRVPGGKTSSFCPHKFLWQFGKAYLEMSIIFLFLPFFSWGQVLFFPFALT